MLSTTVTIRSTDIELATVWFDKDRYEEFLQEWELEPGEEALLRYLNYHGADQLEVRKSLASELEEYESAEFDEIEEEES